MGTMYVVKRVLGSITSVLKGPGSAGPLEVENSGTLPVNVYFKTTNPGDTQVAAASPMPVTAASLPLPSGAATSALQGGGMPAALAAGGGLKVEGVAGGVAQPVSGTFWQATQPCSDAGPSWTSVWGVSGVPVTSADMSAAAVAVTDAPTGGQKLVIDDISISSDTALKFTLTEETSGTVRSYARCPAGSTVPLTWRGKMKLATADKKLLCQSSAAGNVEVLIGYHSEA